MKISFIPTLVALLVYCFQNQLVSSISACDPTDVFFIIDASSVRANSKGLISLIDSVIDRGSNEETGYSVIIYGEGVPPLNYGANDGNDKPILCEIDETTATKNRPNQIAAMNAILEDAFETIINANEYLDRDISIEDALHWAKEEAKSDARDYTNTAYLNGLAGVNVDEDIFMVFDYNNYLGPSGHLEKYALEFEDNKEQSIHFIFGTPIHITPSKGEAVQQEKETNPSENALRTHMFLFQKLIDEIGGGPRTLWDQFLDLTCPAMVDGGENCKLGLGNHVQLIEADTVVECHLEFTEKMEIDHYLSYLIVIDELGPESTATFNVGDDLMVDQKTAELLPSGCDGLGAVRIIGRKTQSHNSDNTANILRLEIRDHTDLSEFITSGKCEELAQNLQITTDKNRRRMFSIDTVLSLNMEMSDAWETSANYRKTKVKNGATWVLEADGTIETSYSATFDVSVGLYVKVDAGLAWDCLCYNACFCWSPWSGWGCCVHICAPCWPSGFWFDFTVELRAGYGVGFRFDLDFTSTASFHAPRLLYLQKESIAFIGPVPIKYRPWLEIDLLIEVIPIHANVWVDCEYGHDFKIGYEYKSQGGGRGGYVEGPTPRANTCDKGWGLESSDEGFPRRIGIDTTLDGIIGLDFYKAVSCQFIAELTAPLYLSFTPDSCSNWGPCDGITEYKPAVLTFEVYMQPYWAIEVDLSKVGDAAKAIAASILDVFGISINLDLSPAGAIDKGSANKIGGQIKLFAADPVCMNIAGYAFVDVISNQYCGDCATYNNWVSSSNCPAGGSCSGLAADVYPAYCPYYLSWGYCDPSSTYNTWTLSVCATTCGCAGDIPPFWYRYIGYVVIGLLVLNIVCVGFYCIRKRGARGYKYKTVSMETDTETEVEA